MQLALAAAQLKVLAERPNRYPGRADTLSARAMAIILTELLCCDDTQPTTDALPSKTTTHTKRAPQ
jgi:hypothetical protein